MKMRLILLLILVSSNFIFCYSQIIHTESFTVILDTNKAVKGSFIPDFKFQNLKKNLIEFENTSDISFKIKKSIITVANKFERSKYGNDVFLSGGFL